MEQRVSEQRVSGRREQNKDERRRRILDATLAILGEKGFDKATTREIAERAHVAAGTVFLYAENKVDLFLLSLNDQLDQLNDAALAEQGEDQPLLDQLVTLLRPRYAFWARHPELYRAATGDRSAYGPVDGRPELAPGIGRRGHAQQKIGELLRRAAARQDGWPGADLDGLARIVLDIYLMELRFWLSSEAPEIEDGLAKLRYLLGIVLP